MRRDGALQVSENQEIKKEPESLSVSLAWPLTNNLPHALLTTVGFINPH